MLAVLLCISIITPEPYIIQITFLGDVMLGRGIARAASRNKDWHPFAALQPILELSDISAANLESPLTDAPVITRGYALCAPPSQVSTLKAARINLLTIANNHNLDCGEKGLEQTRSTLQSDGLHYAGPVLQPAYIYNHGSRIAILALDDISSAVDLNTVKTILKSTASQSDLVIISIHWGNEYQPAPSSRQRNLARALINAGANVIIGHHPHVIQDMETIIRADGKSTGLVFYSLGNALFDQQGLADTRIGEIVRLYYVPDRSIRYSSNRFEINPREGIIQSLIP
jgi:gamma-polyglutamate biosynthesis protein CapA